MGVALSMPVLAAADLASGRLVAPLQLSLPLKFAYYIVTATDTAQRPDVVAFRDWLLAEAAKT
jgi:LysR family glycine cleavage system transcriptional activator